MGRGRFVAMAVLLAAAPASPALAQGPDPDVIVDPDSPSAKEYAIPLERARKEAATGNPGEQTTSAAPGKPRATPLFGVGIAVRAPSTRSRTSKGKPDQPARRRSQRGSRPPAAAIPAPPPPDIRALVAPPDGGIGDAALLAGGAAAVLLLGALLGLAVRRRPPRGGDPAGR